MDTCVALCWCFTCVFKVKVENAGVCVSGALLLIHRFSTSWAGIGTCTCEFDAMQFVVGQWLAAMLVVASSSTVLYVQQSFQAAAHNAKGCRVVVQTRSLTQEQ